MKGMIMRKLTTILTAALITVGAVAGEMKTTEAKAAVSKEQMAKRRALAEKFLVTMKVEKQMSQVFQMIQQSQSMMLKKMFKDAKQVKSAEEFQSKMMTIIKEEMSWAKLKPIFIRGKFICGQDLGIGKSLTVRDHRKF